MTEPIARVKRSGLPPCTAGGLDEATCSIESDRALLRSRACTLSPGERGVPKERASRADSGDEGEDIVGELERWEHSVLRAGAGQWLDMRRNVAPRVLYDRFPERSADVSCRVSCRKWRGERTCEAEGAMNRRGGLLSP